MNFMAGQSVKPLRIHSMSGFIQAECEWLDENFFRMDDGLHECLVAVSARLRLFSSSSDKG